MLGYYLTFDGERFPNPKEPQMSSKTVENVTQSEAGSDLVCVVRPSKKSWSFSFDLSSRKKAILQALCENERTTMVYMGRTYDVRVRDYTEKLAEGSEWVATSEGLFACSVKVTEY